jgi:hypothetical protein
VRPTKFSRKPRASIPTLNKARVNHVGFKIYVSLQIQNFIAEIWGIFHYFPPLFSTQSEKSLQWHRIILKKKKEKRKKKKPTSLETPSRIKMHKLPDIFKSFRAKCKELK